MRSAARASYNDLLMRQSLKGRKVRDFMTFDPVTVPPDISIESLVGEYVYRHHFKMFPVVSSQRVLGCTSIDEIRSVPRENWGEVTEKRDFSGAPTEEFCATSRWGSCDTL